MKCCPIQKLADAKKQAALNYEGQGLVLPTWLTTIIEILEEVLPLIPLDPTPAPVPDSGLQAKQFVRRASPKKTVTPTDIQTDLTNLQSAATQLATDTSGQATANTALAAATAAAQAASATVVTDQQTQATLLAQTISDLNALYGPAPVS